MFGDKIIKTFRVKNNNIPGTFAKLATVIGIEEGSLGDIRTVRLTTDYIIREITVYFNDEEHLNKTTALIKKLDGVELMEIKDEVLDYHEGGKIRITSTKELNSIADLRKAYTPGVAQICREIIKDSTKAKKYTSIGNTVAIVTNGTAVLGLGDIGPLAGMPVMEGKSLILDKMVDVSAIPVLIESKNADEIIEIIKKIALNFSVIQLEDIAAPDCFAILEKLKNILTIPIFHDDQHGTAVVVLAALQNACKIAGKDIKKMKIVINGAGAAGLGITRILLSFGITNIILCDREGSIYKGRKENMNEYKEKFAGLTNPDREKGLLADIIKNTDVFIGVSVAGALSQQMVKNMDSDPIIFALANPVPEIEPQSALNAGAVIAKDGRSINNALAYPGIIKGLLNSCAKYIDEKILIAASESLAEQGNNQDLLPDVMDRDTHLKVAQAVEEACKGQK